MFPFFWGGSGSTKDRSGTFDDPVAPSITAGTGQAYSADDIGGAGNATAHSKLSRKLKSQKSARICTDEIKDVNPANTFEDKDTGDEGQFNHSGRQSSSTLSRPRADTYASSQEYKVLEERLRGEIRVLKQQLHDATFERELIDGIKRPNFMKSRNEHPDKDALPRKRVPDEYVSWRREWADYHNGANKTNAVPDWTSETIRKHSYPNGDKWADHEVRLLSFTLF